MLGDVYGVLGERDKAQEMRNELDRLAKDVNFFHLDNLSSEVRLNVGAQSSSRLKVRHCFSEDSEAVARHLSIADYRHSAVQAAVWYWLRMRHSRRTASSSCFMSAAAGSSQRLRTSSGS